MDKEQGHWRVFYYTMDSKLCPEYALDSRPDKWKEYNSHTGRSLPCRFDTEVEAEEMIESIYKYLGIVDFYSKYGKMLEVQ